MPSDFEALFATSGAPALMAQFGRPAAYYPPSGAAITGIKARLGREQNSSSEGGGVRYETRQVTIKVLATDVSNPATGGRFVIEEESWQIVTTPNLRAGCWECPCEFIATERQGEARVARA